LRADKNKLFGRKRPDGGFDDSSDKLQFTQAAPGGLPVIRRLPLPVKAVIGLTVFLVASLFALFLAGIIFMLLNKNLPNFELLTWYQYWWYHGDDPTVSNKLYGSLAFSMAVTYLFPIALYFAASSQRPLHGAARFANILEIKKAGLLTADKGIIVGKYNNRFLVFPGQQFVILAAPTRSGKGVSAAIPNLLTWEDSVVCLDIKQTNFQKTAGFRKEHEHEVYLWNPFAEDGKTHRCNILSYIRKEFRESDITKIGHIFWPKTGQANDDFFNDQARNLFLAIVLYISETPELPLTMGEVLRQGSGTEGPLIEYFTKILDQRKETKDRKLSNACVMAFNIFFSNAKADSTLAGIISCFTGPLTTWTNPIVDAATSGDDFDLRNLRKKKMAIYVGVTPDYLPEAALLMNAFFSTLINMNTKETPEQNKDLQYQCLLILDEFTAMGRVNILAKSAAYIAEYGLRVLTIIQSLSQLDGEYGKETSRTYVTNHALQIIFAPREQRDANEASEMLGYLTQRSKSRGTSRSSGSFNSSMNSSGSSNNISEQRRALLMPQEVKEIGQDKEIIALENTKPILCDKIRYYEDPELNNRIRDIPEIPKLDMEAHYARTEKRVRAVTLDDLEKGIEYKQLVSEHMIKAINEMKDLLEIAEYLCSNLSGIPAANRETKSPVKTK
jgi:type IV secretion system protein VirD4